MFARSGLAAAGARAFSARAGTRTAAPAGYDLRTVFSGVLAAAGGVYAITSHIDVKIDNTNNKLDTLRADTNNKLDTLRADTNNKLDMLRAETNNKIDALGVEMRSAFSTLHNDMRSRDDKLSQMLGTTLVLEGNVGRLMDTAIGREQQQRREPPPSACDKRF